MKRFKWVARAVAFFAVVACLTGSMFSQTSNGTIAGVVTDSSGAAITNAQIVVKSAQTGETRTAQTNSVGAYRFESVMPGDYSLTVSAPSFSPTNLKNVHVNASVITSANATLKVGSEVTVDVEGTSDLIKADSGELSNTITESEVKNLPIANLNAYSLATTLPGVVTVAGADFTNGTSFSVNGTRPRANNFLIEGQDNNDAGIHGQGLQPSNLDAVQQVTVLTNSYSAEFGHGGGSVSNLVFKSGTNTFHGALWDLLQNSALNATDKNDVLFGTPKASFRENTYGFNIGGPVKKDKIFFFASYQWDKFRSTANGSLLTVPTAAGVATLQSLPQNQRITNLITAIGNLRGQSNVHVLTLGNGRPAVEVGQVARTGIPNATDAPELDLKGDILATSKDTLSLRYIRNSFSAPIDFLNFPSQLPGFDTDQNGVSHNAGINETHTFGTSLVNELRLSYGRIGFSFLPQAATSASVLGSGPSIGIAGLTGFGAPGGVPQGRFHNTYQYQDAVSWTKGTHSLKFGADISDTRVRDQVPFNSFGAIGYAATTGFSGLANYIDDIGGLNSTVSRTFGNPTTRPRLVSQSYYAQDSWRMRPNLTLTYGLRYEYDGAPSNVLGFPTLDERNPFDPNYPSRLSQKADSNNFGPRLGFAYTPRFLSRIFGSDKTVIRGGFGIFYDQFFTNILDNTAASSPNAVAASSTSRVNAANPRGTPNWSTVFAGLSPVFTPFATQQSLNKNIVSPETMQWNLDVQRSLPGNFTVTAAYVGTRGEHLFGQNFLNPIDPNTGGFTNPTRGQIIVRDNSGDSIYHGLDLTVERRFSHGFQFRSAYTYSKLIDDVSEIFTSLNLSAYPSVQAPVNRGSVDRGPSAFDRRHRWTLVYIYDPPKWNANGNAFLTPLAYLVNNWQVSGTTAFQSGATVNVEDGFDANGDGISNDRPSLGNAAAPLTTYAFDGPAFFGVPGLCEGTSGFNTNNPCVPVNASDVHWIIPGNGIGNVGRNSVYAPYTQTWNFSLQRTIPITEKYQFEFRSEMFNIFNRGNVDVTKLNSSLVTGIPFQDDPAHPATNTFLNFPQTVSGNRSIRFWLHFRF